MKTLSKLQQLSFIIRREFLAISTSYAVLLVLMGGIFVYGLLYNYMYAPNIVTDVPVAVVDNSHSELSRDFIRWLDATPQAEIFSQAMDYHEAKEWMKEGKVQGILYLPHDFEERVFRGDEAVFSLYATTDAFLYFEALQGASSRVMLAINDKYRPDEAVFLPPQGLLAVAMAKPINVEGTALYNYTEGYGSYLIPAVMMIIIFQTLLMVIGMVTGEEYSSKGIRAYTPLGYGWGVAIRIVAGKTSVYCTLYAIFAFFLLGLLPHFFSIPNIGNGLYIVLLLIPYLMATSFLGLAASRYFTDSEAPLLMIAFFSVPPGRYILHVRAISREEHDIVFQERAMKIIITQPFWSSWWAILCYILLVIGGFYFVLRVINLRKQKNISDEKTQFFINTAHDIRTPLTLIKAPLEELLEEETLTDNGITRTNIALRNVEVLLRLVSNLINFERTDVYSSKMSVSEYELNTYMNEIYNSFSSYAAIRRIEYTYESTFSYMNVSFDKEKMDSILKNIISNSLKYTPENGKVSISVSDTNDSWKVIIKDTGIGIPASEQSKLFKLHFRASNAINSKVTGSGIGLMLVGKLVSLHGGKISVDSVEHQGTTIKIVFPKKNKTSQSISDEASSKFEALAPVLPAPNVPAKTTATIDDPNLRRILVVEDNDELRSYLVSSLSSIYNVQACANGKEALIIIKEYWPELVLSDIMMPEMRGDELCVAIKSDIEISHIPVLLLTALGEENNILDGLSIGADEYLIKPFSVKILRANIANLLANRELLRMRYANLDIEAKSMVPSANGTNSLDWKFISNVKKIVDENINNPEFSVNVLCESSGMSRTSFYCKLKALTGQSPTEFIRGMRLKRATELLKEGEYAINEISDMVGFSETKYFREVFKKYYKMSPSRYAKEGGNPSAELEDDEED